MPATFLHNGNVIDHTPDSPLPAGRFVRLGMTGEGVGITTHATAAGQQGSLAMSGVWRVPCRIVSQIEPGTKLYLDSDDQHVTDLPEAGQPYVGISLDTSIPGQPELLSEVRLRLNH